MQIPERQRSESASARRNEARLPLLLLLLLLLLPGKEPGGVFFRLYLLQGKLFEGLVLSRLHKCWQSSRF
jgi:hypothetical protein